MTIKHKIKVDRENKVLTLLVDVPKKALAKDENLSFNCAMAWNLVKGIKVKGYKVNYKKNGLIVDNWRRCNHTGSFVFPLEEEKLAKRKSTAAKPKLKTNDSKPTANPNPRSQGRIRKKNKD